MPTFYTSDVRFDVRVEVDAIPDGLPSLLLWTPQRTLATCARNYAGSSRMSSRGVEGEGLTLPCFGGVVNFSFPRASIPGRVRVREESRVVQYRSRKWA